MFRYILKRVLAGFLSLFVLITVTFFLMHSIPGGPFSPEEDRRVPEAVLEKISESYGLNDPLPVQYKDYLKNLAKGNLGISFKQPDVTVNEILERGTPVSAKLGAIAVLFSLLVGIPLGIISAVKRGTGADMAAMVFSTIGISIPNFVMTVLLMYFFAVYLQLLPTYGLSTWKHYILPVLGLSFTPIARITRLMRSSMLEVMEEDYVRTARSKGVPEFFVIVKHALKNAIIPVVTYLGPLAAALLTGTFVVERLFSIPGVGREFVTGISDRDYSITLGMTIYLGCFIIIVNIIVDVLYVVIDPRVKIDE